MDNIEKKEEIFLSNYIVTKEELTVTANALREKSGSNENIEWENGKGFKDIIDSLETGGDFTITRMYIDTPPNRTIYNIGSHDVFDPTGMVVMIDYTSDNLIETGIIINGYTYPTRELTTSDTSITLSYTVNGQTVTCQQAIEVYEANSVLNNNSWKVISGIAQAGTGDTYWDIGDCKEIILNGKIGGDTLIHFVNFVTYIYILDFNHPINKTIADNNIIFGGFKTALNSGIDIALCDSKYNNSATSGLYFNMNHKRVDATIQNSNYGGWKGCDFRYDILGATETSPNPYNAAKTTSTTGTDATTTAIISPIVNTLMAALPSDFRNVLRLHTHYVDNKGGNTSNADINVTKVVDAIFLLSEFEIYGKRSYANNYEQNHQKQMAYYANGNNKIKYKHNATNTAACWWESSTLYNLAYGFCDVETRGTAGNRNTRISYGVAPAFKV